MDSALSPLILEPGEGRAIEQLRLHPRRNFSGRTRGERLTKRKGVSIEFADYREYSYGDDLRHLDWNVLARLESRVIKTYQDEEDMAVYLLLDCSASMDFGEPAKSLAATKIAAAIGLSALCSGDALMPRVIGKRLAPPATMRARASYPKLCRWIAELQPDGDATISRSVREFMATALRAGLVVIVSDGLDPDFLASIKLLCARGNEVWLVQVLSAEEMDPEMEGDLKLVDVELGATVEITANSSALQTYRRNLTAHCEGLKAECRRLGGRYAFHRSDQPLINLIKNHFKKEGWMQ